MSVPVPVRSATELAAEIREGLVSGCRYDCGCSEPGNFSKCVDAPRFAALAALVALAEQTEWMAEELDAVENVRDELEAKLNDAAEHLGDLVSFGEATHRARAAEARVAELETALRDAEATFRQAAGWLRANKRPMTRAQIADALERDAGILVARAALAAGSPTGQPEGEICRDCNRPVRDYVGTYWNAPDDVWNEVWGDEGGILCPRCFVTRASDKGIAIAFTAFEFADRRTGQEQQA